MVCPPLGLSSFLSLLCAHRWSCKGEKTFRLVVILEVQLSQKHYQEGGKVQTSHFHQLHTSFKMLSLIWYVICFLAPVHLPVSPSPCLLPISLSLTVITYVYQTLMKELLSLSLFSLNRCVQTTFIGWIFNLGPFSPFIKRFLKMGEKAILLIRCIASRLSFSHPSSFQTFLNCIELFGVEK